MSSSSLELSSYSSLTPCVLFLLVDWQHLARWLSFPPDLQFASLAGQCCRPNRWFPPQNLQVRLAGTFFVISSLSVLIPSRPLFFSFFTRLLVSLTLRTSSFMDWPSDLICVFEASLALQLLMQHWSVNCCCCNNRLQAPLSLIPSTNQGVVKTIAEVAQLG